MNHPVTTPSMPASDPSVRLAVSGDARAMMAYEANKKSLGASYALWFFLGGLGGHRFYNGRTGSAAAILLMTVVGLLTLPLMGLGALLLVPAWIWVLVDAFLIPGWIRNHNNLLIARLGAPAL